MNRIGRALSSTVIAVGMSAALSPTATLAAQGGTVRATPAQVQRSTAPPVHSVTGPPLDLCILIVCLGGGGGGGTTTPELPSSVLIGIGLLPPLGLGLFWRRRRRR